MSTPVTSTHRRLQPASPGESGVLRQWRGLHEAASIVVCGCGPSLRELKTCDELVTIGVNDVGRMFDPSYLVVVNPRAQFKDDRFKYVERSNARALFTQLDLGAVKLPVVRFKLGRYGGVDPDGETLHYTQNSPYVAVCLAAHMGAKRIGLIGVDFTDDHFFARTGRHPLAGRLREIDAQYGRLAAALERRGVELVNLSSISRLTSLRRMCIERPGDWRQVQSPRETHGVVRLPTAKPLQRSGTMKVSVDKYAAGVVADLLDRLAHTAKLLGHDVVRQARRSGHERNALAIVWNGRNHAGRGPTLYCEHGWLPRSAYQISPRGINADSHLAPFNWSGHALTGEQSAALDTHIASIKAASYSGYYQYMQAGKDEAVLPSQFLLVPLQIELDTNIIRHAPTWLRSMQSLVDYVSRINPPWPVIFKQHPADSRRHNQQMKLRIRRKGDRLWPHSQGNIHQMLKSPGCRGILTINSNVAHDGLLWDVPAIVLGRNVWPSTGDVKPFLTAVPTDWSKLAASVTEPDAIACRRAYAHYLMSHQWTLADAADPTRVAALLKSALANRAESAPNLARPRVRPRPLIPPTVLRARPTRAITARPLINVVAANKGWLFESWKQRFAATQRAELKVAATDRPMKSADAWIFIRTREVALTPDPARTLVQIHDLADGGRYQLDGERAAVRECAALSFSHARQKSILQGNGIDVDGRSNIVRAVGWTRSTSRADVAGPHMNTAPRIAWLGRPVPGRDGSDASQLPLFLDAARRMPSRPCITLIGEKLERSAAQLRGAGIDCRSGDLRKFPLARMEQWLRGFDCIAITGETDAGPWPLFDALHCGVPVVATRVGWATDLLADGACGRLVDDAASMAVALREVLESRQRWFGLREQISQHVAEFSSRAWVDANLDLALTLARPALRRVA